MIQASDGATAAPETSSGQAAEPEPRERTDAEKIAELRSRLVVAQQRIRLLEAKVEYAEAPAELIRAKAALLRLENLYQEGRLTPQVVAQIVTDGVGMAARPRRGGAAG